MGYILNGQYHKGEPPVGKLRKGQSSTFKGHDHNRQRKDYAREIVQPFTRDGKPNPDYLQAYPEGAVEYGFLPSDEELRRL